MSQQLPPAPEQPPAQLREWLSVIRLRKWSIIAVAALVVGGAMFFSYRVTPVYESSARVLVEPISLSATTPGLRGSIDMPTEAGLVSTIPVAERVAERVDADRTPLQLLPGVTAESVEGSKFLDISFRHTDPELAQAYAQAFAREFLKFRQQQALEEFERSSATIDQRIEQLTEEIAEIQEQIDALPDGDPQRTTLQSQITARNSQIATYQAQQIVPSIVPGQIVVPARVPVTPVRPNHVVNGALAVLLGLALGVATAFLRERLDDRLRGKDDLAARSGAPVLAVVPRIAAWKRRNETPLVTTLEPRSAAAEAYRTLRTSVLFAASQYRLQTMMITSPQAGEGKTATSANLAATLAQAGKRVIAIDADLRKPRLHKFFKANSQPGLTDVLAGEIEPWEALFEPQGLRTLRILPSGRLPGNPAELLGSDAMGQLLARLADVADFVVIDTSPVLVASDPLSIAGFADAVLFAADSERTTRGAVDGARQQLEQVNARVIGSIFNNFDPSKAKAYPYYYNYYYYTYQQYAPAETGNGRTRAGGARRANRRS